MSRIAACILLAAGIAPASAVGESENAGLYLYKIPAGLAGSEMPGAHDTVQVDLYVQRPDYVAEHLAGVSGLDVIDQTDGYVSISIDHGHTLPGDAAPGHSSASFVVDFEEPPVSALIEAMREEIGAEPSVDELVDFAFDTIESKSYRRNFDIASQVAISKEGDCTEHAVLLTALARGAGKPARVVFGVLMLQQGSGLFSFGHAWTEIHDGHRWRIADATRPELETPGAWIRYLPMFELGNEGPGYTMEIMQFAMMQPQRIDRLRPAPAAASTAPE